MKLISKLTNFKVQVVLLLVFNILDVALTSILVNQYGPSAEANLYVRGFIENYGNIGILIAKAPWLILISLSLLLVDKVSHLTRCAIGFANIVYFAVVCYSTVLVCLI